MRGPSKRSQGSHRFSPLKQSTTPAEQKEGFRESPHLRYFTKPSPPAPLPTKLRLVPGEGMSGGWSELLFSPALLDE